MKRTAKKLTKPKDLEEKVNFIIDFLNNEIVTKDYLDKKLEEKSDKSDINRLTTQIDGLAKLIKDYHQEMVILVHRVERMEMWIKKASVKLGIPYEF